MPDVVYSLYLDDSGTRAPDHIAKIDANSTWFALGGILFLDRDKSVLRAEHRALYSRWPQIKSHVPLHSSDIRMKKAGFSFLAKDETVRSMFLEDLSTVLKGLPVLGHACVIDREGYRARYAKLYGNERWLYCKTAFAVVLERAVKFARARNARLRVYVEETAKGPDDLIRAYYSLLLRDGMPFTGTSRKYAPLGAKEFRETLYGLKMTTKTSAVMQLADLFLWPICKSAYVQNNSYTVLKESRRLIDSAIDPHELEELGIKYSCFDQTPPFARI